MKKDTKNTYEIDIINFHAIHEKDMIEWFREQTIKSLGIPFSYFTNKNIVRKVKINKIISKWD